MAKIRITYRDPARIPDEVTLGAFAQIAAKRRYGLETMKAQDPEVGLFGCFVELEGPARAAVPEAFDEWLMTIEDFDVVKPPAEEETAENPTPAETPSSSESPGSPPTSE